MIKRPDINHLLPDELALEKQRDRLLSQLESKSSTEATHPPRNRRFSPRLVATTAGLAAVAIAVVALLPAEKESGRSASSGLLERAEAALSQPNQILVLDIRTRWIATRKGRQTKKVYVSMRQFFLAGADKAGVSRMFSSTKGLRHPPPEEDRLSTFDRKGRQTELRTWDASGQKSKTLTVDNDRNFQEAMNSDDSYSGATFPLLLRWAYEEKKLKPVGSKTGLLRLRGHLMDFPGKCGYTEALLDPNTFIPRRMEVEFRECGKKRMGKAIWTIKSKQLVANKRNRRLLKIGNWPTKRWELNGKRVSRDEMPEMPTLDE